MEKIDLQVAQGMIARYQTTRKALIDKTYGLNDTQSVWFDIASFKEFVAGLPAETTGVRVYLAAYDATQAKAPNQTTLVFIGTDADETDAISTGKVLISGFDPQNLGKECPPFCPPPIPPPVPPFTA
ncbi:hypothetical protein SAMN05216464_109159 [Mucilaginibacter pineti]|uniref:Uncharacterized protein n=1 Tax=Mucilaginibacter pineti TaxID=1391627 RepID=A0A1G7FPU0_9SPHI|nr:hypothetical protein [Mucilaginibacter pineti]SDE77930.1 hypothetical protein SAMN05216464_109159 [Mucilaginibacter pineti]